MPEPEKDPSISYEDRWLPHFEKSASEATSAERNIGHECGHRERRLVFIELIQKYLSKEAKSVLDVGCGSGTYFDLYSNLGLYIYGVDFSKAQIDAARKGFPKSSLHACLVQDAPEDIQADLAVSIGVTQVVSDLDLFFSEIARRVAPEGIAIISCLNRRSVWPGGITDPHLRFFTLKEMRSLLGPHFEEIAFRRFYPLPGPLKVLRGLLYKLQIPLMNHGIMFVLKKR